MTMEVERVVEEAREAFESGGTRSYFWRRSQLKALMDLISETEIDICDALMLDLGKHRVEAYRDEVGLLTKSVNHALENLKKWMKPEKVSVPLVGFPSTGEVVPEPLGVILIFASWNFPIGIITRASDRSNISWEFGSIKALRTCSCIFQISSNQPAQIFGQQSCEDHRRWPSHRTETPRTEMGQDLFHW